jgi:hypothetical protein
MTFIFFFRGGYKGWSILYHPLYYFPQKKRSKADLKKILRIKNLIDYGILGTIDHPIDGR